MKTSLLSWSMVLVTTALVACGDDTSTSTAGSGGSGGEAATTTTGGTPTSTNTTTTGSSPTTAQSTSSTASGDQGGAGGGTGGDTGPGPGPGPGGAGGGTGGDGGDTGAGGDNGCEDLEFTDLEYVDGAFQGGVDPSLGGALEDFGVIVFTMSDHTVDLSLTDPFTSSELIFAGEDFDPKVGYAAAYVANEGTITVTEDGWDAEGVVLREINLDDGTFVTGGVCYNLADTSGDVVEPFGWLCDPSFYDAADGCDCECGIPDPDCDLPDQQVFNCEAGQTCSDEGLCEGVPTAWECTDAQYEDGTTCDCECGAIDPDCDGVNVVAGCPNVDDQCIQDTCVPSDETGLCLDLGDNDVDGSIDCADADCAGADCTPGAGPRDSACDAHNDCDTVAGNDPVCVTPAFGVEFNFCSEWCDLANDDCGAGALCFDVGVNEGTCLTTCDDVDDCADNFDCVDLQAGSFVCLPADIPVVVPDEWTCNDGFYAADDGCDCGCGVVDPDCADATIASCGFCGGTGACDEGSADCGLPGDDGGIVSPTDNSTCL